MNRNVESHFALTPQVEKPRSTFDRSFDIQTTFNVGDLIVLDCQEIYPGDTFKCTTAKNIRLQTLLNPLFDTLYLDTYHFFCPDRIVYDHSEEMFGANKTSAWIPEVEYVTPTITPYAADEGEGTKDSPSGFELGSLADYFGLPVGVPGIKVNALPFRMYHMIWDSYFRDENLQDPLNIYTGDADKMMNEGSAADDLSELYPWPRKVARYHSYLSSALPAPQKGPDVQFPLIAGDFAPVYGRTTMIPYDSSTAENPNALRGHLNSSEELGAWGIVMTNVKGYPNDDNKSVAGYTGAAITVGNQFHPDNLWADLRTSIGMTTINDLRQAFQIQRMYEADALYGSARYYEILRGHFGIVSPDARLQRPEYLGGNRVALNVHQVVNSSESASYDLGNLGAMSHTVDIHDDYVKSFVEHGFIITVCCVRYSNSFCQGIERFWSRDDRFSYYWPTLAHLGNQAILNKEIYAQGTADDDGVFGYQEAWAELRYSNNKCTSLMRPGVSGSLAAWNLCDYYTELPTLSDGWIKMDKGIVDRTLAVTSAVSNQVLLNCHFNIKATRVLPMYSIPGLIDHF